MSRTFLNLGITRPAIDLTSGLIAAWNLADLTDASGNGYTLTGVNTPTFSAGKIGNGMFVALGSAQYAKIAHADAGLLKAGSASFTSGFTIAGWVYVDSFYADFSFGGNCFAASNDCWYGAARGWMLGNGTTGFGGGTKLNFQGGVNVLTSTSDLNENAWNFVAMRWNGGTGELFVNGTTAEGSASVSWNAETASDFNLGNASNGVSSLGLTLLDGGIDALDIWERALSDAELAYKYNSGTGREYPYL